MTWRYNVLCVNRHIPHTNIERTANHEREREQEVLINALYTTLVHSKPPGVLPPSSASVDSGQLSVSLDLACEHPQRAVLLPIPTPSSSRYPHRHFQRIRPKREHTMNQ
ncbi:hypothetical protein J3458_007125 [Metarhizium acridum]|uniref:uncharacterized protein n=1 Tax=Metarhizium acridum TaxID=92637 RepID=UPI001C6B4D57|nr:hypothetical protein J3458_007125 [Metarhizium acridum]